MNAEPIATAAFRDRTQASAPLNLLTRVCLGCRKTRSLGQFTDGKKKCKQCRGKK